MLRDAEIVALIGQHPNLIEGLKYDPTDPLRDPTAIQASSVDLTIGDIFLPETASAEDGGAEKPLTRHNLKPGHTAVVTTFENLNFPADVAGFGFPPARVSKRGLLMTNPGHVDPGYSGHLAFTVIALIDQVSTWLNS